MLPFGSCSALLIVCVRQRTGLCWWLRCTLVILIVTHIKDARYEKTKVRFINFTTLSAGLLYCYWYCLAIFIIFVTFDSFFPIPLATRFQFEWKKMPCVLHRKANYSPVVSGELLYFFYAKIAVCWTRQRWSSVRLYSEVPFQNERMSCRKIGSHRHIKNCLVCKCCRSYWHHPTRFIETRVLSLLPLVRDRLSEVWRTTDSMPATNMCIDPSYLITKNSFNKFL
jgi:hypothetical protein